MHEPTEGEATFPHAGPGWLDWVGQHPGVVLLGALVVATLALNDSPRTEDVERDTSGEEVPLFI
ncbi:MAG: hypothetical protein WAO35_27590 [Terriglobia bacterium]